jgi:hypothetical protein
MSTTPHPAVGNARRSDSGALLYRNQDGAIMVIGVFIAIVLVGLLFYIAGVGQIVFRRERVQDAADAVALATAIGHARGMNLIVFINMVMAALVAILLALKLIELLLTGLELILVAISWFVPPAAGAIPIVEKARSFVHDVHDSAKDIIDNIIVGLNMAERAIAYITPAESMAMATLKVTENYGNVIDVAVGVPTRFTLPVVNDKYDTLCDRGGIVLLGLIKWATDPIPFIGKVIGMAMGGLLEGVKHAFCYEDQKAPSAPLDITRMLPMDATGVKCEEEKSKLQPSQACKDWEQELMDRHPEDDGDCVAEETDKDRAALCKRTMVAARQSCQPGVESHISSYSWSEQEIEEKVVFDTEKWQWVTKEIKYVDPPPPTKHNTSTYSEAQASAQASAQDFGASTLDQKNSDKGQPCDNRRLGYDPYDRAYHPEQLWSAWNVQTTWEEKEFKGVTRPVCSKRKLAETQVLPNRGDIPPETPDHSLPSGFDPAGYTLRYPAVKQVYGCTQEATIQMTFPTEWGATSGTEGGSSDDGEDKAPQKMEEGVLLGSETFQIRGVVANLGDRRPAQIDYGLHNGAFERKVEPESWVDAARLVGKVGVAQAEYYFNHNGIDNKDPKEWMWHMDWRARLVRFRMPSGDDDKKDDDKQGELGLASLSSGAQKEMSVDMSDVPLPEGFPGLDSLEQLIVH